MRTPTIRRRRVAMSINFAMWRKAIWQLIKMDDKRQWDALDVVSKWLIATRSAVTLVTVYSCVIAGLLAWRDGHFSWIPWIIVTLGLFIAHRGPRPRPREADRGHRRRLLRALLARDGCGRRRLRPARPRRDAHARRRPPARD